MKRIALSVCTATVLVIMAAAPAHAAEQGWYLGAGAGFARADLDEQSFADFVGSRAPGVSLATVSRDEDSVMFKLFLGYSFTSFLALEANLFRLGEFATTATTLPAGTAQADFAAYGTSLDLVALMPFAGNWRVFGRVGGLLARSTADFAGTGAAAAISGAHESETKFGWKAGGGIGYEFDSGVAFRAEYEYYRVDDGLDNTIGVSTVSGSFLYRFR
jgi:opacity protein-like surface antigen